MQHKVLSERNIPDLVEETQKYLDEGWLPQGGMTNYVRDNEVQTSMHTGALRTMRPQNMFCQTITFEEEKKKTF